MNSQEYIEVSMKITPFSDENAEILMAELDEVPFESFTVEEPCLKGFIPTCLALHIFPGSYWPAILCGTIAILGHMWTIYLKFRGGKGVATSAGVFAALLPIPTGLAFAAFVVCVALWGRISIGSIVACIVLPIASFSIGSHPLAVDIMALAIALLVIYKHIPNIKRLLAKKELAFEDGAKKRKHENK